MNNFSEESSLRPISRQISIRHMGEIINVNIEKITLLEGNSNYTYIYTQTGEKYLLCRTLKTFSEVLSGDFIRIHKSFIINTRHVVSYSKDRRAFKMSCGNYAQISKRKVTTVIRSLVTPGETCMPTDDFEVKPNSPTQYLSSQPQIKDQLPSCVLQDHNCFW